VGDEQTKGRGRQGRSWFTPPAAALAASLVLHPTPEDSPESLAMYAGLGALAIYDALAELDPRAPEIKWPNDVLLHGKKVSGILAESHWEGDKLKGLILGMGVNISPASIPPSGETNFPATSIDAEFGGSTNRWELLHAILKNIIKWRSVLHQPEFVQTWQARLAFKDVPVSVGEVTGRILGLTSAGHLWLRDTAGQEHVFRAGEVHLRPS
jgi:BirA family biotin operon repressor/biotin-[acetyl-CoA-carboxylase] ligase